MGRHWAGWPIVGLAAASILGGCAAGAATPSLTTTVTRTSVATATASPTAAPRAVPTATASPIGKPTPVPTPTATPKALTYGPVTVVTGVATCPSPELGKETKDTDGVGHYRGGTFRCTVQTDDARVSGTETESWNADGWGTGPSDGALVQWGTVRLENPKGAWEGTFSGVYSSDRGDIVVSWYKGTGGYSGLSYIELLTGTGPWTIQGQIQPGDPPSPASLPPLAGTTFAATASADPALPTPVTYGPVTVVEGSASEGPGGNDLEVVSTGPGGVQHMRASDSHWVLELNDPRVGGANVADLNFDAWGSPSSGAAIQWGRMRTTNAQGAWDGAFTGTWDPVHGDTYASWLTGSGAYAGLTFFYLGTDYPPNKLQGLIYPGAPPKP